MKRSWFFAAAVVCAVMVGCGNPVDQMLANGEMRTRLWDTIAGSPDLSGQVVDRLLAADSTRTRVLDRIMANSDARQAMLTLVAKDRTLLDGAINFAVQDSSMRDHVMTLVKGMEMGGGTDRRVPFPQGLQIHQ